MQPRETIERFDRFLAAQGIRFEAVVVGGAALGLLGVVTRPTRDCDVLRPRVPAQVKAAAARFAAQERARGRALQDDWLNDGPAALADVLPRGWERRVRIVFRGQNLVLRTLGRADLLKAKLFALCDRAIDLPDCLALAPTPRELERARRWLHEQDTNPGWPAHVDEVLDDLTRRLRNGLP